MKRRTLDFLLPLAGLALCLGGSPALAGVHTEEFTSTLYRDATLTTAWWDTASGELKMYPFLPELIAGCDSPGEAYDLQVAGRYAFVADGTRGLRVFDINDPGAPVLVGGYETPGIAYDVCVAGNVAYIADGASGVHALDISQPTNPTLMGSFAVLAEARGVCMAGDLVYVAYYQRGLIVLKGSAVDLVQVGSCLTPGDAVDVQVAGDRAYVADRAAGLQVLDISDPTHPAIVGACDTPGLAVNVFLAGDTVYLADSASGVQVIDVSAPAAPTIVGSYDTPGRANGVWVDGDWAYVADSVSGLLLLDVADPSLPVLTGSVASPGEPFGVVAGGEFAFLAAGYSGLQVFEVCSLAVPTLAGAHTQPGVGWGVDVAGDYAYLASDILGGMQVIDISDPTAPTLAGWYNTLGRAMDVVVAGDRAYVAGYDAGLQVLDVSDPSLPTLLATLPTPNDALALQVAGDIAYVADYGSGLQLIDIGNPAAPAIVGAYNTDGLAYGVWVDGDHAFVADAEGGLVILDVSTHSAPALLCACPTPGSALGVFVTGDLAYVADGDAGLQVFDIADPTAPVLRGGCDTPGSARNVWVAGRRAFVADWSPGVHVFDVRDPYNPVLLYTVDPGDNTNDVCVAGEYAYMAFNGSFNGLKVAQVFQRELSHDGAQGASLPVSPPGELDAHLVDKVRLTTQQAGEVSWEVGVTPVGGAVVWHGIQADGQWHGIDGGWSLRWRSTHLWSPGTNPTATQVVLEWLTPASSLVSVADVAGDQGGWLRAEFMRSTLDFPDSGSPVTSYGIWRRVDDPALASQLRKLPTNLPAGAVAGGVRAELGMLPVLTLDGRTFHLAPQGVEPSPFFPPGIWEWVASVPALQINNYLAAVPTQADRTPREPNPTVLVITAHTIVPSIWYVSLPDSGSSLDNIAPGVPEGLAVAYHTGSGNRLSWEASADEDFQYFNIYRGDSPDFEPTPELLVHSTIDLAWSDPDSDGWDVFYRITALDHVENESDPASPEVVTGVGTPEVPRTWALHAPVPNPFNPSTTIAYDVPAAGSCSLRIYNAAGRRLRTLADGPVAAGRRTATWDGRDAGGRVLPAGVYFCRLAWPGGAAAQKLMLVK